MATCADIHAYANSIIGKAYDFGYGMQCVALIMGVSNDLGIGFDTYCKGDLGGAKELAMNAVPSGWHKVPGDPYNDANAKQIWNTLPNGAIVIFTNSGYGHVAIKNNDWGAPDDTINQNWGAENESIGNSTRYGSCGNACESNAFGFLEAWVSDDNTQTYTPPKQNQEIPKNNPMIKNPYTENKKNLENIGNSIKNFISDISKKLNENIAPLNQKNDVITNGNITVTSNGNLYKVNVNKSVFSNFLDNVDKILKNSVISTPPNIAGASPQNEPPHREFKEDTDEEKVNIIIDICLKNCPTANAFGIAGLVGNFVGESSLNPKVFEAEWVGAHIATPDENHKNTAEDLFGGWGNFVDIYPNLHLNEAGYLFEGQHFIGCGLGQWTGVRSYNLWKYGGKDMWTTKKQMEFAFSVEEGQNAEILRQCLTNSESIDEGVENVYKYWERASVPDSYQKRLDGAYKWYDYIDKKIKELRG